MNDTYPYQDVITELIRNNEKFSLTDRTLTVVEKNNSTTIDLDKISGIRITKYRVLYINYCIAILIIMTCNIFEKFINFEYITHFMFNFVKVILIIFSLGIKKYSYKVLINTVDLNFKSFKIKNTMPILESYLISKKHSNFSPKVLSRI